MANTREISGRIKSIRDTMKITNAMYMISSTKMRKAKRNQEGNEPYFEEMQSMYELIMSRVSDSSSIYLDSRPKKKGSDRVRAIVVVTSDKGLAGAYNHNVIKEAEQLMNDGCQVKLCVLGEFGRQYYSGKVADLPGDYDKSNQSPDITRARELGDLLIKDFKSGEIDEVYVVYTAMKNSMTSEARCIKLLPFARAEGENSESTEESEISMFPSPDEVLEKVIPEIVIGDIYSALVESFCSEQNDRMMAMDAANKNADAMLKELSIEFNRVRQAMITQEITEVVAGAKAQKKKKARKEAQKA